MSQSLRKMIWAGLLGALFAARAAGPLAAESLPDLSAAISASVNKSWDQAAASAARSGPLAQALVDWHRLRAGEGSFPEYLAFAQAHPDWPGMELLRQRGEDALRPETPDTDILAWFDGNKPQSPKGALAWLAALGATGKDTREAARGIWTSMPMDRAQEAVFLAAHGPAVEDLHDARVFALLDQQEWQPALLALPRMTEGARPLAAARIALQSRQGSANGKIAALSAAQRADAGLALDQFRAAIRAKQHDTARRLMQAQSASVGKLRMPELWASARADYARAELRDGDWAEAEAFAAPHFLTPGSEAYAELEFLAGYAALHAGAADRALTHFDNLAEATGSIISQSRALYWQGRAYEAAGDEPAARATFGKAATMQTAYYGQLAAERIEAPLDPALAVPGRAEAALPQWRRSDLRENEVFQAGVYAFAAGQPELGQRFFLHLAETAAPDDIARMARLTLEMRYPWHALRLAKRAAARGAAYPAAYFPLTGLETEPLDLPPELVMAIARQESEFNHTAASHVGAQGLMQLMPGTAREMAEQTGLHYDPARLSGDAYYNARLGAAYLRGLRARFGPSSALVAVGYNAGPGRSRQWTERFGDIRTQTDPVDWVEMIPFDETRNYVMRVTEALPIYRARISGRPVALHPTQDLTGGGFVPPPPRPRQTLPEVLTTSPPPPRAGDPLSPAAQAFDDSPSG